jgi:hypothetical protein
MYLLDWRDYHTPTFNVPGTIDGSFPNNTIIADDPFAQTFKTSTSELDKFRLAFLVVGVLIGYYVLRGR